MLEEFSTTAGKTTAFIGSASDVPQLGGTLTGDRRSSGEEDRDGSWNSAKRKFHARERGISSAVRAECGVGKV